VLGIAEQTEHQATHGSSSKIVSNQMASKSCDEGVYHLINSK
jgi:hypothetical protein